MSRNINQAVQGKHQRADQGGETEALVSPDLQGSNALDHQYRTDNNKRDRQPSISDQIQNQSLSG
jgi:hypothetical protein